MVWVTYTRASYHRLNEHLHEVVLNQCFACVCCRESHHALFQNSEWQLRKNCSLALTLLLEKKTHCVLVQKRCIHDPMRIASEKNTKIWIMSLIWYYRNFLTKTCLFLQYIYRIFNVREINIFLERSEVICFGCEALPQQAIKRFWRHC